MLGLLQARQRLAVHGPKPRVSVRAKDEHVEPATAVNPLVHGCLERNVGRHARRRQPLPGERRGERALLGLTPAVDGAVLVAGGNGKEMILAEAEKFSR
mgnify:CR=1 FL=1